MTALFPTYGRFDIEIDKTEGTKVWDTNGNLYTDFGSGIGVANLGHRHPAVQTAVENQLQKYWHMSNLYHIPLQEEVASKLTANSSGDYVFFGNSGAEANEAAIKLARKATGKTKIITFQKSFHGRTFATMSATGQEKIQQGFGPLLETFTYVEYNNIESVKEAIDGNTAAIMIESVQGEGGVLPAEPEFFKAVAALAAEEGILLIVDEIQTGIGRTGKPFAYQHYGVYPDIITSAKGLGNGLPVGAMIAKKELGDYFGPGSHGSTFGGNPLAMAAANKVLELAFDTDFLQEVEDKGKYLLKQLQTELAGNDNITDIRGKGLMIGIECKNEVLPAVLELMKQGLLVLNAGPNVLRLLPPLIVTNEEIDEAVKLIGQCLKTNTTA
ncbi:acetylornithine transaminase [Aciduricibacillus chroicocephali]|uniref:Acetylornithine aminotransferase n=1 Tax=Aciduricibacillus chroicocephali TaxID=3054939 RepID=A0ABY9KXF2_9BACI|nr:acetylornithine transaminase [Bacillaceae bacterium 44XB]